MEPNWDYYFMEKINKNLGPLNHTKQVCGGYISISKVKEKKYILKLIVKL